MSHPKLGYREIGSVLPESLWIGNSKFSLKLNRDEDVGIFKRFNVSPIGVK